MRIAFKLNVMLLALLVSAAAGHPHPDKHAPSQFIRFVEDNRGNARLESAETVYRNRDGVTVELIAAVHIADAEYFRGIDEKLSRYEAMLYEMVKPKGADVHRPRAARENAHWIAMVQRFLKTHLDLEFQLDAIDYTRENFVHADLDAETFARLQAERGESIGTLMLQSMLHELTRQQDGPPRPQPGLGDLLAALNSPDRARELKLLLGRQFIDIESQLAGMEGPRGSVILTERNKAAMKILRDTIAAGKKDIAIFYGAGHLSGMEKILVEEMQFERVGQTWRTAWDMSQ
jgi:hypothetical protein